MAAGQHNCRFADLGSAIDPPPLFHGRRWASSRSRWSSTAPTMTTSRSWPPPKPRGGEAAPGAGGAPPISERGQPTGTGPSPTPWRSSTAVT